MATPIPQVVAGRLKSIGGVRRGRREPALFVWPRSSHRSGKSAAVDQQILAGDVAGVSRAQKSAGCAEFVRAAEALRRDRGNALGFRLVEGDPFALGVGRYVGVQALGIECAGKQKVD